MKFGKFRVGGARETTNQFGMALIVLAIKWYKNYNSDNQTLSCSLYVVNVLRKKAVYVLNAINHQVCE